MKTSFGMNASFLLFKNDHLYSIWKQYPGVKYRGYHQGVRLIDLENWRGNPLNYGIFSIRSSKRKYPTCVILDGWKYFTAETGIAIASRWTMLHVIQTWTKLHDSKIKTHLVNKNWIQDRSLFMISTVLIYSILFEVRFQIFFILSKNEKSRRIQLPIKNKVIVGKVKSSQSKKIKCQLSTHNDHDHFQFKHDSYTITMLHESYTITISRCSLFVFCCFYNLVNKQYYEVSRKYEILIVIIQGIRGLFNRFIS